MGGELKPYFQSITEASLDVRAVQQHVERIYDLVFISLFNTILGGSGARDWEERERKEAERESRLGTNERTVFHLLTSFL